MQKIIIDTNYGKIISRLNEYDISYLTPLPMAIRIPTPKCLILKCYRNDHSVKNQRKCALLRSVEMSHLLKNQ
jgi:hypothetical protein